MKFLVTGVGGQLGYDVMQELAKRGHEAAGSDIAPEYQGKLSAGQSYFAMDITDKAALKKVSTFNNAVARYIDDREIKTLLTSSLTSLKVSKKETDVIGVIVKTIIDEYKKYMEGFTRNLYIPRWI